MPRPPRRESESGIYHVIVRGEGRMLVFEDDDDRLVYLRMLKNALDKQQAHALAWCLMANHVHLLVKVQFDRLPLLMMGVSGGYAVYYNKRHDHVGHVFSGRYKSIPVETDEYLMQLVRYIHFNPVKERLSKTCDYKWSSYGEYLAGSGFTDTGFVLDVCGGLSQFVVFHEAALDDHSSNPSKETRRRLSDSAALALAKEILGEDILKELATQEKAIRNEGIAELRRAGLSTRQIERFTGIGRGIVSRVEWK